MLVETAITEHKQDLFELTTEQLVGATTVVKNAVVVINRQIYWFSAYLNVQVKILPEPKLRSKQDRFGPIVWHPDPYLIYVNSRIAESSAYKNKELEQARFSKSRKIY